MDPPGKCWTLLDPLKSIVFSVLKPLDPLYTRDVFYVRREVDLMKTAKVNAHTMHIFGKIELLSIHAT